MKRGWLGWKFSEGVKLEAMNEADIARDEGAMG